MTEEERRHSKILVYQVLPSRYGLTPTEGRVEEKLKELRNRLVEINDLGAAAALLSWDQSTYMPPGGAAARARQLATLGRLALSAAGAFHGALLGGIAGLAGVGPAGMMFGALAGAAVGSFLGLLSAERLTLWWR